MASARTSDHQPIPIQAARSGSNAIGLLRAAARVGADGFHRFAGDALVGRPVGAAHAAPADAFAFHENRAAAFHSGPAPGARGEGEPEGMGDIERLPLRAVRGSGPLVRGGADGFGRRRVQRMKAASIHAFEHDQMSARIGNRNRDRDPGLPGLGYGGVGYFFGASVRDRKSTRLNSSHRTISYAVFCL